MATAEGSAVRTCSARCARVRGSASHSVMPVRMTPETFPASLERRSISCSSGSSQARLPRARVTENNGSQDPRCIPDSSQSRTAAKNSRSWPRRSRVSTRPSGGIRSPKISRSVRSDQSASSGES